jgi:(5-formylfuran-3-yl)methyl phosphate synthase
MTWRGLLVSVRDAEEAAAALEGGAAIIDVKEPAHGPLGRPGPDAIAAVNAIVAGRRPWTLAGGELSGWAGTAAAAWCPPGLEPPAAIKIGLANAAGTDWQARLAEVFASFPSGTRPVAVAYADWRRARSPEPAAVIAAAATLGCAAVLVDTFDKAAAGLFDACAAGQPAAWVRATHDAGLAVAVAGRIGLEEIPGAWALGPDVVAVRSAVCSNGRFGRVSAALVRRAVTLGLAAVTGPAS